MRSTTRLLRSTLQNPILTCAALLGFLIPASLGVAQKPNIIFIMADDLGTGHLGFNGQKRIQTPHIDRLRAQGLYFSQVYAGCSVCAPCRSVLMTGKHMGHTSVRGNSGGIPLLAEDVTVPEVLKKAGYVTGCFGKWGLGDAHSDGEATRQGFDEFFGYYDQVHAHSYYPPYLWHSDRKYFLPGNSGRDSDGLTGEVRGQYAHDEIQTKALSFIQRNRDRSFFCYVPFTIPHTELLVPDDSLNRYAGKFAEPNPYITESKHYQDQPQPRAAFAAMISRMDRGVGQIMRLLELLEIDENTIVFFTSDNGAQESGGPDLEFFNGNGPLRGAKGVMYEGGIRVPMIVRWPGRIKPGSTSEHPWYFPDVMPTLAELAGAVQYLPEAIDGISVVPAFLEEKAAALQKHEFMYWELRRRGKLTRAVRMGNWKAVSHDPELPLELYDLSDDISESRNVSAANTIVLNRIKAYLETCRTNPRPPVEPQSSNGWSFR